MYKQKRFVISSSIFLIIAAIAGLNSAAVFATPTINEYPVITNSSGPEGITPGPDGNLWFTEFNGGKIGKITLSGTVTEYTIPTPSSDPSGIIVGPDGNMWFAEFGGDKIGKITLNGAITEFTVPTVGSGPGGMALGSDGNIWFTEENSDKIGKITTSGTITEYNIPTSSSRPEEIAAGPDGNLWFAEDSGNKIGKITTSGTITEYTVPTSSSQPLGIAAGPDGNVWFTETVGNKIGKITPSGTITEYNIPTSSSGVIGIVTAADGNLWFTEQTGNKVGTITPSGTITEYSVPTGSSGALAITEGPDGNIWFTENSSDKIGELVVPNKSTIPNGGDANDDTIPDSSQPYVADIFDPVTNNYAVLQASSTCSVQTAGIVSVAAETVPDSGYTYPAGLMNFTLSCTTPGFTANITQFYYGVTDNSNFVLRKFNPTTKKYSTVSGAVISQTTIDGQVVTKVTYQITDGGPLDQDNTANGTIVDPSGLALPAPAPNTGFGTPMSNRTPIILTVISLPLAIGFLIFSYRRLYKKVFYRL